MGKLTGKEPWYDVLEHTVGEWVAPLGKIFENGFISGIETATSASWTFVKTHPVLTIATLGVGALAIAAYRHRGLGVELGRVKMEAENVLGHFEIHAGFGRKPVASLSDLGRRIENTHTKLDHAARIRNEIEQKQSATLTTLYRQATDNHFASQDALSRINQKAASTHEGVETLLRHHRSKSVPAILPLATDPTASSAKAKP